MRRLIGLGLALLLLGACGASASEQAPGDAARGASLWANSACVGCHGLDAEGSTAGPALIDTPLTVHDMTDIMRRGTPGMPQYPASQISDDDLRDLHAWFLNPVPLPTPTAVPSPTSGLRPTSGPVEVTWAQSACAACHDASAQGGAGPSLAGTTRPFADFLAVVRRGAMGMPAFPETQMSDLYVQALYDWLQLQRLGQGEVGAGFAPALPAAWVDALCGACHGTYAEGASGPALIGEDFSLDEFQRVVREGEEGMPSYDASRVSDADIQQLYDWLMALP